jgi:four helix bundle protein
MRRAAVSIPSNVAEGHGVKQSRWSLRYVGTAIGSSLELETQLEVAIRLGFVSRPRAQTLSDSVDRVQKLLDGLRRKKLTRAAASAAGAGAILVVALLRIVF